MLQTVVRGLCRRSGGLVLVAGAIGVLAGVEHLMSGRVVSKPRPQIRPQQCTVSAKDPNRYSVRRTHSELGYTYWVLQGHGCYSGFALFDTWKEAIDEAQRRLTSAWRPELAFSVATV